MVHSADLTSHVTRQVGISAIVDGRLSIECLASHIVSALINLKKEPPNNLSLPLPVGEDRE